MPTSPATTWLRPASLVALRPVACAAGSAGAAKRNPTAPAPPPVLRFPDTVSDGLVHDLAQAGRVTADLPPDPEQWKRWGRAAPDDQDLAVRAVVDALSKARPPIELSAMILAIARVESGFNPFSENPTSTACGIFQFVEGTWQSYAATPARCFDPDVTSWAGRRQLAKLDMIRLGDPRRLLQGVPDEVQRIEYLYRLLYAYHYHGVRSVFASIGGSL